MNADVAVVGGGTVGAAIAYGLAAHGIKATLLDGGDRDFRAANANFGLVWLQGKGMNMPDYQRLTSRSLNLWPAFAAELEAATGMELQYERNGGLTICLGEAELEQRRSLLQRLHEQLGEGGGPECEMLDRTALTKLLPSVPFGNEVTGASFGLRDGHVNPLRLLAALHRGIIRKGGQVKGDATVGSIRRDGGGFRVDFGSGQLSAGRVVIAAGLGSKPLAAQIGLDIPVFPERGQILVTERLEPLLPFPMSGLRQTREGTVMIGATNDAVGFDTSTTVEGAAWLSARAIRRIPALGQVRLVRHWSGLRIMTPDSHPIYAESESHPGAFVALCHSGVTLAATHATSFAEAIAAGSLPSSLAPFHHRRFDVPKAA